MNNGWIKIHRKLLEWEWYEDHNTFRLFFHLLLKANHKPKKYRGVNIETGQVMTGLNLLAEQTGLTIQKVRTALNNLKSTSEITIKTSSKGTIIQIVKYVDYQVTTSKATNEQQTDNKPITTNKNVNKEKNEKNIDIYPSFNDFWDLYDKKINSKVCESKWSKLTQETKEYIINYLPKYINSTPDKQYRKNPTTFLNNQSWNDEITLKENTDGRKESIGELANAIRGIKTRNTTLSIETGSSNGQIK